MSYYFISLLFIVICEGRIKINIKLGSSKSASSVSYHGAQEFLSSDNDVALFNITDWKMKKGIEILLGKQPNDVFLRDPTYYNNIFKDYGWKEVTTSTKVKNIEIFNIFNRNIVLKRVNHINNTSIKIDADVKLFETLETSVVSTWSKSKYHANIVYNISFDIGPRRFELTKKWKENATNNVWVDIGTYQKGFIPLDPGHVIIKTLSAKKTTVLLRVNYITSLTGCVVANYSHVYGKYHFWAPFIADIMRAMKMKNEIMTTELIEIQCYTDPELSMINMTRKQYKHDNI